MTRQGLSQLLSEAIDDVARHVTTSTQLRDSRRHLEARGRVRALATVAAVMAAVGVTSAAWWGTALNRGDDASPTARATASGEPAHGSPSASASHDDSPAWDGDVKTVELPLDFDLSRWARGQETECGQPAPRPQPHDDDFSLSVTQGKGPEGTLTSEVTYSGQAQSAVTIEGAVAVLIIDGKVAARSYGAWNSGSESIDAGWVSPEQYLAPRSDSTLWCNVSSADQVLAPAGSYDVYVIQRIHRTSAELAIASLAGEGYTLSPRFGTWAPGSIDCEHLVPRVSDLMPSPQPIACDPQAVRGVTVDATKGTVTLPYVAPVGEGDVDATLVSGPFTWTFEDDVTGEAYVVPSDSSAAETPTCGSPRVLFGSDGLPTLAEPGSSIDMATTTGVGIQIDTGPYSPVQRGSVSVPASGDAWIISQDEQGEHFWGRATARLNPSGTFAIDRSKAPPSSRLYLDGLETCGAPGEPTWVLVTMPITAMAKDGTPTRSPGLAVLLQ